MERLTHRRAAIVAGPAMVAADRRNAAVDRELPGDIDGHRSGISGAGSDDHAANRCDPDDRQIAGFYRDVAGVTGAQRLRGDPRLRPGVDVGLRRISSDRQLTGDID